MAKDSWKNPIARGTKMADAARHTRSVERWRKIASRASNMPLRRLGDLAEQARELRYPLTEFLATAEGRLAMPRIGQDVFQLQPGTDWSWRPEVWRGPLRQRGAARLAKKDSFGEELSVFHDCSLAEISLHQHRNRREDDLAPFGLGIEVFGFSGSFLSLVLDLPDGAVKKLAKRHVLRVDTVIEAERPCRVFARLNVRHGPNTDQLLREFPAEKPSANAEFDLAYSKLNEKRIESAWLDLIFEEPAMNAVFLRDLAVSRYPRADL